MSVIYCIFIYIVLYTIYIYNIAHSVALYAFPPHLPTCTNSFKHILAGVNMDLPTVAGDAGIANSVPHWLFGGSAADEFAVPNMQMPQ